MRTPKDLTLLVTLLQAEADTAAQAAPKLGAGQWFQPHPTGLKDYMEKALAGHSFPLCPLFEINRNGNVEIQQIPEEEGYKTRLIKEGTVRFLIRCAQAKIPLGGKTRDTLAWLLRNKSFLALSESLQ